MSDHHTWRSKIRILSFLSPCQNHLNDLLSLLVFITAIVVAIISIHLLVVKQGHLLQIAKTSDALDSSVPSNLRHLHLVVILSCEILPILPNSFLAFLQYYDSSLLHCHKSCSLSLISWVFSPNQSLQEASSWRVFLFLLYLDDLIEVLQVHSLPLPGQSVNAFIHWVSLLFT